MSSVIINNNIDEAEPNETSEKRTAWHIKLKYSTMLSPGDTVLQIVFPVFTIYKVGV